MKNKLLIIALMLSTVLVSLSCSGEDGEQGIQGKQGRPGNDGDDGDDGTDGTNGISCWDLNGNGAGDAEEDINEDGNFDALDCQGEEGTNGLDGNANVKAISYDISDMSGYAQLSFDLKDLVDDTSNYAYLYYIGFNNTGIQISIPGNLGLGNGEYTTIATNVISGEINLQFFKSDDTSWMVPGGIFSEVIVIAVELTTTSKNSDSIMSELKSAGVDISDYKAVVDYFRLK